MSEQQWFVVSYWDTCHNSDQEPPGSDESIWTLSEDPKETGWTNDCDQNSYGLTKDKADFFAKAANSYFPHLELIKELAEALSSGSPCTCLGIGSMGYLNCEHCKLLAKASKVLEGEN